MIYLGGFLLLVLLLVICDAFFSYILLSDQHDLTRLNAMTEILFHLAVKMIMI